MKRKNIFLLLIVAFTTTISFGQAVPPPIPPPPPPPGLPIDGGIFWLFIAGILFGVKKLKKD